MSIHQHDLIWYLVADFRMSQGKVLKKGKVISLFHAAKTIKYSK